MVVNTVIPLDIKSPSHLGESDRGRRHTDKRNKNAYRRLCGSIDHSGSDVCQDNDSAKQQNME